jgi:hypothetical protein
VAAPALGGLLGGPLLGCASGALAALALVACQVPHARALVRSTQDARYWSYVPFGASRAAFRGVGMVLGVASILTTHRARRGTAPATASA